MIRAFLLFLAYYFSTCVVLQAQNNAENLYTDDKVFTANLYERVLAATNNNQKVIFNTELAKKSTPTLSSNDKIVFFSNKPNKVIMPATEIYASRVHSVLMVGRVYHSALDSIPFADIIATAFVIDTNGNCVTNYHVLRDVLSSPQNTAQPQKPDSSFYFIQSYTGEIYFIDKIIAYSLANDLAVFHIEKNKSKLTPIPFGSPAKVGQEVYVLAHPDNNFYYLTKGMVGKNFKYMDAANTYGTYSYRMGITADYAIGSSGGPLLDNYGNLIGVVSSTRFIIAPNRMGQQMVLKNAIPVYALTRLLHGQP